MLIKNGTLLHYNWLKKGTDLRMQSGVITEIGKDLNPQGDEKIYDARGRYVLPGLIDIHTHGILDASAQRDLVKYSKHQLSFGVTGCVATLVGSVKENIETMKLNINETNSFKTTPNILGFRPEITYLAKTGAGSKDALTPISTETSQDLWEASRGTIVIWDVSAELPGAAEFVKWASDRRIVTSLAHTSATVDDLKRCIDQGLSLVTHMFDVFDAPEAKDGGVYPAGLTDYILIEDRLTIELIPDGAHVHPHLWEKAYRCKGMEKVATITDSVLGAASPPGIYEGLYPGVKVKVTEDRGMRRLSDDALSGSTLSQLAAFNAVMERYGKSLVEASTLCSRTPAEVLGLQRKGYLDIGMDGDAIILNRDFEVDATFVGGELLYEREGSAAPASGE